MTIAIRQHRQSRALFTGILVDVILTNVTGLTVLGIALVGRASVSLSFQGQIHRRQHLIVELRRVDTTLGTFHDTTVAPVRWRLRHLAIMKTVRSGLLLLLEEAYLRLEFSIFIRIRHANDLHSVLVVRHHRMHHGARVLLTHVSRGSLCSLRAAKHTASGSLMSAYAVLVIGMHLGRNQVRLGAFIPWSSVPHAEVTVLSGATLILIDRQQLRVGRRQGRDIIRGIVSVHRRCIGWKICGNWALMMMRLARLLVDVAYALAMQGLLI